MSQIEIEKASSKSCKKLKVAKGKGSIPVRLTLQTKLKIDQILDKINKSRVGRKVRPDDLICFSLDLLTESDLELICSRKLSNKDRIELLYQKQLKIKPKLTKDEFLGFLLEGKVSI